MSAQPSLNTAYKTEGNAASKEPAEKTEAAQKPDPEEGASARRGPKDNNNPGFSQANPTSSASGIRGAPPGEEAKNPDAKDEDFNEDAQQMAAPGDKAVSDAVRGKDGNKGATGGEEDTMGDINRKADEQEGDRQAKKGNRDWEEGRSQGGGTEGVDVKAALAGRGLAASEV